MSGYENSGSENYGRDENMQGQQGQQGMQGQQQSGYDSNTTDNTRGLGSSGAEFGSQQQQPREGYGGSNENQGAGFGSGEQQQGTESSGGGFLGGLMGGSKKQQGQQGEGNMGQGNMGQEQMGQQGAAGQDWGDKAFGMASRKAGHPVDQSTGEKITDSARAMFEKTTGKHVPEKMSN